MHAAPRSGPEIADVFREHGAAYRAAHALSPVQRKAWDAILACRTAVLGGHLDVCADCGLERPSYNSCRNRHCPKCQGLAQARWLAARQERVLPVHHFHVVFTLPAELRPLARLNPVLVYDLLFAAASDTLLTLAADPNRLGAVPGITAVLHTWTRELAFHPHLHCIVTGGGLAPERDRWVTSNKKHLLPVQVLAALFRGKLLAALCDAHGAGALRLPDALVHPAAFAALRDQLYRTDWVVYAKPPFGGADQVFAYLGRYTHRVGISNRRLRSLDASSVTFGTKGGRSITLAATEFIRRFLLHVLPHRYVKIRHFGLLAASNVHGKLETARQLLGLPPDAPAADVVLGGWQALLLELTGIDATRCPLCRGLLLSLPLPRRRPGADTS